MVKTIVCVEKEQHGKGVIVLQESDHSSEWSRAWEIVEQMTALGWSATIAEEWT